MHCDSGGNWISSFSVNWGLLILGRRLGIYGRARRVNVLTVDLAVDLGCRGVGERGGYSSRRVVKSQSV